MGAAEPQARIVLASGRSTGRGHGVEPRGGRLPRLVSLRNGEACWRAPSLRRAHAGIEIGGLARQNGCQAPVFGSSSILAEEPPDCSFPRQSPTGGSRQRADLIRRMTWISDGIPPRVSTGLALLCLATARAAGRGRGSAPQRRVHLGRRPRLGGRGFPRVGHRHADARRARCDRRRTRSSMRSRCARPPARP